MKYIFIPFFILTALGVFAQPNTRKTTIRNTINFPKSYVGHWQGTMTWYPNNGKASMDVAVQLIILPIKDSANQYTWQIIYGKDNADNRPYVLKQVDTIKNHWVVDEKNGIILDSYWLGGRFSGVFAVQGSVVLDSYWLDGDALHFEFFSYPQKAKSTTGDGTESSLTVETFKLGSYQKGVLKKIK